MSRLLQEALIIEGVSATFEKDVGNWAFGEGYGAKPVTQARELWNARHRDLFEISPTDPRLVTTRRIVRAWKEAMQ